MSFKILRRKSASPGGGVGGSGRVSLLHAVQQCCSEANAVAASSSSSSFSSSSSSSSLLVRPAPSDLHVAYSCLEDVTSKADIESAVVFFKHELNRASNSSSSLLLVLQVLDLLMQRQVREFHFAVLKGGNALLGDLENAATSQYASSAQVAARAQELLEVWAAQFAQDRALAFRIDRTHGAPAGEEDAFMRGELARFDALLSSLEDELGKLGNAQQLDDNALVRELVRACDKIGPELRSMIELSSQDLLTRLLEMNDRLLKAIAQHQRIASTPAEIYNPFDDPNVMAKVFGRDFL